MQNKCYWPYVSNLADSFSKAKGDKKKHAEHTVREEVSQVWNEHKIRRYKKQSQVLVLGLNKRRLNVNRYQECKTKPTDKLTSKTNVNVKQIYKFLWRKKKRRKKGKLVIPFLYFESTGVNGVDTPDPHLLFAETDRFPAPQCPARLSQKWSDWVDWRGPGSCGGHQPEWLLKESDSKIYSWQVTHLEVHLNVPCTDGNNGTVIGGRDLSSARTMRSLMLGGRLVQYSLSQFAFEKEPC